MPASPQDKETQVLQAFIESGHLVEPEFQQRLATALSTQAADTPRPAARPPPSPEEISQKAIDLLLREYYQLQRSLQLDRRRPAGPQLPGAMMQAVLAVLCFSLPEFLELRSICRALAALSVAAAYTLYYGAPVFIPLWLAVLRAVWLARGPAAVACPALLGLAALLATSALMEAREPERWRARHAAVKPADVKNIIADAQAHGTWEPNRLVQQQVSTQQPAAARAATPVNTASLSRLVPDITALQKAILGSSSLGGVTLTVDALSAELARLSAAVGLPCKACNDADALATRVAQLKAAVLGQ